MMFFNPIDAQEASVFDNKVYNIDSVPSIKGDIQFVSVKGRDDIASLEANLMTNDYTPFPFQLIQGDDSTYIRYHALERSRNTVRNARPALDNQQGRDDVFNLLPIDPPYTVHGDTGTDKFSTYGNGGNAKLPPLIPNFRNTLSDHKYFNLNVSTEIIQDKKGYLDGLNDFSTFYSTAIFEHLTCHGYTIRNLNTGQSLSDSVQYGLSSIGMYIDLNFWDISPFNASYFVIQKINSDTVLEEITVQELQVQNQKVSIISLNGTYELILQLFPVTRILPGMPEYSISMALSNQGNNLCPISIRRTDDDVTQFNANLASI